LGENGANQKRPGFAMRMTTLHTTGEMGDRLAVLRGLWYGATIIVFLLLLAGCGAGKPPTPPQVAPPEAQAVPRPALPEKPLTQEQIALVQSILTARGYKPGPADGKMGPRTSRAISGYQRDNGLPIDGTATSTLIRHMQGQPEVAPQVVAVEAAIPSGLYPIDTRFVYSGVEIHSVIGVEGGRVSWETNIGDHYVTGPHFGLPQMEWQSGTWKGITESTLPPET